MAKMLVKAPPLMFSLHDLLSLEIQLQYCFTVVEQFKQLLK